MQKTKLIETVKQVLIEDNFQKWFGKSVLKHDDGKPMTFYHGSGSDIPKFSYQYVGKGNDALGSGFYFADNPDAASVYALEGNKKSPNVLKVHLRLENPIYTDDETSLNREHIRKLIVGAPNHEEGLEGFGDIGHQGYHSVLNAAVNAYSDIPKFHAMNSLNNDFYRGHEGTFLQNFTKITGHDGVIKDYRDGKIVNVFHPNQIKSAISNTGEYNREKDNITENFL